MDTVKGFDNADIELQVDLADDPDCSTLVLRLAFWDDRDADNTTPPHDIYAYHDWVSLDLNDARRLRAALDEKVAQIEAHDAAFNSDDDNDDAADVAADGM